jgi:choice-of-anchor C domain-containing protein
MKKTLILAITLVLLITCVGMVSANLVTNGGFESPSITGSYTTYSAGDGALFPWVIEAGSIDLIHGYWQAADADQSIDLAGLYQEGAISQDIPTSDSQSYDLSFAMAGNPDNGPVTKRVQVWWDNNLIDTYTFNTAGKTHTNMGWITKHAYNLPGKTASSSTNLTFADVSEAGTAFGTALDQVVVVEHVIPTPEFPTIALPAGLIIGLIGTVFFIRKSKEE